MSKLAGDKNYYPDSVPEIKRLKIMRKPYQSFLLLSHFIDLFTLSKYFVQDCRVEQREDTLSVVELF